MSDDGFESDDWADIDGIEDFLKDGVDGNDDFQDLVIPSKFSRRKFLKIFGGSIVGGFVELSCLWLKKPGKDIAKPEKEPVLTEPEKKQEIEIPRKGWCVLIKKKEKKLFLYKDGRKFNNEVLAPQFPYIVALGTDMPGDKRKSGDLRTPEGEFFFTHVNKQSRYYLSFGISYPAQDDAKMALNEGRINKRQHDAIISALEKGEMPPASTDLGGEIFLHGEGDSLASGNWTLGCPAVSNGQMDELYRWIGKDIEAGKKIPVIILP